METPIRAVHLTREKLWEDKIRFEGLIPTSPLIESHGFLGLLSDYRRCNFAILEEEVKKWKTNPRFIGLWDRLLRHITAFSGEKKVIALSFEILPEYEVEVLDRAPVARYSYEHKSPASDESYSWYVDSRIPLRDYNGHYELPELAIYTPIEAGRLRVAKDVVEYNIRDRIKNSFLSFLDNFREDATRGQAEPVSAGKHWKLERGFS